MTDAYPLPLRPEFNASWPEQWRESYHYDRLEVWDDPHPRTLASLAYTNAYKLRRHEVLEAIGKEMPAPARVLDLAAAQGNFTAALVGLGYQVTWNDLRGDLEGYVRQKLPPNADVEFAAGNIFDLGDSHIGRYDAVIALEVIEHVAHPDEFIGKLATLLRPGGVLIMSTPNGGYFLNKLPRFSDHPDPSVFESMQFAPNSDGHIFLLYEDELRRFAQTSQLEVADIQIISNPLTAGHIKLRYALGILPAAVVGAVESVSRLLPSTLRSRLLSHLVIVLRKPAA